MLQFRNRKRNKSRNIQQPAFHVRKGDTVMVITGKDKGKTGVVKAIITGKNRVVVEGLNKVKKAVKPNPFLGQRGGIIEMEAPIHVSNVMVYDTKASKATRTRTETIQTPDGSAKRVRVSKKSGEQLDV